MEQELKKHILFPSMIFVNREGYVIETILGSCIAVCLYADDLKIGGMNHYMLPVWNGEGLATPRYGNVAIDKLNERMKQYGAKKVVAKIFGGASQIQSTLGVGDRNILVAREQLAFHKIKIVAENVGGTVGRKIWFNTQTGQVIMKFLTKE